MGFDDNFHKEQQQKLARGSTFDPYSMSMGSEVKKEEGKTMFEVMKEKRMATEKALEGRQAPVQP